MDNNQSTRTDNLLFPANHPPLCPLGHTCPDAVVQHPVTGRWLITFGHAGFNSPGNNWRGFSTRALAVSIIRRYQRPAFTCSVEG